MSFIPFWLHHSPPKTIKVERPSSFPRMYEWHFHGVLYHILWPCSAFSSAENAQNKMFEQAIEAFTYPFQRARRSQAHEAWACEIGQKREFFGSFFAWILPEYWTSELPLGLYCSLALWLSFLLLRTTSMKFFFVARRFIAGCLSFILRGWDCCLLSLSPVKLEGTSSRRKYYIRMNLQAYLRSKPRNTRHMNLIQPRLTKSFMTTFLLRIGDTGMESSYKI